MVSKQGGRSIQWMDRVTAFAVPQAERLRSEKAPQRLDHTAVHSWIPAAHQGWRQGPDFVRMNHAADLSERGGVLRFRARAARGIANSFRQTIPRMVCLLCLLTSLGERFAFLFSWGAPRPPYPRRKLLKKLEQNFYVLLTFGLLLTYCVHISCTI